jgi:hypothetical protein
VITIPGSPLKVQVGDRGQLQAQREGETGGIFFPSTPGTPGDAGFFLAFPDTPGQNTVLTGSVFGFDGNAGPNGLVPYLPRTQSAVTGSGTAADPLTQVTTYAVTVDDPATVEVEPDLMSVMQTTTYVTGAQTFSVRWDVQNLSAAAIPFKALAAADFFFEGSDRGTGIFTEGPPRFVGGTNSDTGRSGGFVEIREPSPSPAWSAYQALPYGSAPTEVWGKVQGAASTTTATFDNTVVGESVDNAGGVEWIQRVASPLAPGGTATYELQIRTALPAALQFDQTNAGAPQGVPITFTVTAKDTADVPYSGRPLRYAIAGVNPATGVVTIGADGRAQIVDPGTNAGADTVVAFVDLNGNGAREPAEPQASALATFVDNVPPKCTVSVSGDRPGGGGAGKPLIITVGCDSPATVVTTTTLTITPAAARSASVDATTAAKKKNKKKKRKPKKVKVALPSITSSVAPGQAVPVEVAIPKKIARRYAGATVVSTVTVTATDAAGNKSTATASKKTKLAKVKKPKKKTTKKTGKKQPASGG